MTSKEKKVQAQKNSLLGSQRHFYNETFIFKSYFKRMYDSESEEFKRRFRELEAASLRDPGTLDMNQKYDVVHSELQNAHSKWENFEKKKDEETDFLLAKNQEVINHIKDIKMEVYELNRKIDSHAEHKNGKISDDVFYKFFEEKKKKNANLIAKYKEQLANLTSQIKQKQQKITNKDSNNELKFIDFHQLQIENKKYVKEVDEKNKQLLKLKMTIGKITEDKNNFKNKLNDQLAKLEIEKKNIRKAKLDQAAIEKMVEKQTKEAQEMDNQTNQLHTKLSKGRTLEISHHVRQKNIEKELVHILETLQKKLDIEKIKVKQSI